MTLAHRQVSDVRVVAPSGRLDHDNCDAFRVALAEHVKACAPARQPIVLDLAGLEYVSSAGLRCFMLAARQAKASNSRIVVCGMQPVVAEIFQISRFNLVFEVFPSVEAAVDALSRSGAVRA